MSQAERQQRRKEREAEKLKHDQEAYRQFLVAHTSIEFRRIALRQMVRRALYLRSR